MFHVEQTKMKILSNCPICDFKEFTNYLEVKDYFLSNEVFKIDRCNKCGFLFTNPRPIDKELPGYYQSDEYLSHSKEYKGIFSRVYNIVRNYSIKKKYRLTNLYKNKGSILDIGCGTGEVLKYFSGKGWSVKGIEPADIARNYAINTHGLSVEKEEHLTTIRPASYDVITLWHVLEHVPNLNNRMQQLHSILKDDGILIIALPNYQSWDAENFSSFWAAWDLPRHLSHFSKNTFSLLSEKHNFKIIEIFPMKFDSFYVSLLSEKYQSGKMSYLKAFSYGLKSNMWAKKNDNNFSSLIYILKKDLS